jgi:hypothetical protein
MTVRLSFATAFVSLEFSTSKFINGLCGKTLGGRRASTNAAYTAAKMSHNDYMNEQTNIVNRV